jgi:hypothetical protein
MAITNKVSIMIDANALAKINEGINLIRENLPPLITLTPEERSMLPKMGDKTVSFVTKTLEYARQNTRIVPAFLNIEEFSKDVNGVNTVFQVMAPLQKLTEELDDTILLAGSEAYMAALAFYSALKGAIAGGEPGLKNIYDDLSVRFPGRSSKKETPSG